MSNPRGETNIDLIVQVGDAVTCDFDLSQKQGSANQSNNHLGSVHRGIQIEEYEYKIPLPLQMGYTYF